MTKFSQLFKKGSKLRVLLSALIFVLFFSFVGGATAMLSSGLAKRANGSNDTSISQTADDTQNGSTTSNANVSVEEDDGKLYAANRTVYFRLLLNNNSSSAAGGYAYAIEYTNENEVDIETTATVSLIVPDGAYLLLSANTNSGYEFLGWYIYTSNSPASATLLSDNWLYGFDYNYGGNRYIFAKFGQEYTITFNSQGGTSFSSQYVTYGRNYSNDLSSYTMPTKSGYVFNGWWTAASGGSQVYTAAGKCVSGNYWTANNTGTWKYAGNVTLHAQWTASSTYTLTFNVNAPAGTSPTQTASSVTVTLNSTHNLTGSYSGSLTGYTFNGYYTAPSGGTQVFNSGGAINASVSGFTNASKQWIGTSNKTVYAQWSLASYTVYFQQALGNSGSIVGGSASFGGTILSSSRQSKSVTYNSSVTLIASPKVGYTFTGWYVGTSTSISSATTLVSSATNYSLTYTYSGTRYFYAKFTASSYTITYNPNGGSVATASASKTFNGTYGTLQTPTKSGYTFAGWTLLPEAYQQVEYIVASSGQYIDTGIKPSPTTKTSIVMKFNSTTVQQRMFGVYEGDSVTDQLAYESYINGSGYYAFAFKDGAGNWVSSDITVTTSDKFTVDLDGNSKVYSVYLNSNAASKVMSLSGYTATRTADYNLFLLKRDLNGSASGTNASANFYGATIYSGTTVQRNYVPCYRKSDNVVGVYDTVNGTFTASGSGSFTYGGTTPGYLTTSSKVVTPHNHSIYANWDSIIWNGNATAGTSGLMNANLWNYAGSAGYTSSNTGSNSRYTFSGVTATSAVTYGSALGYYAPIPLRAGYTLNGWYTLASGGTKVANADGTLVASVSGYTDASKNWVRHGNTYLFAQYTAKTYTITFANASEDVTTATTYTVASAATITAPTKVGYTFAGWNVVSALDRMNTATINITTGVQEYSSSYTTAVYYEMFYGKSGITYTGVASGGEIRWRRYNAVGTFESNASSTTTLAGTNQWLAFWYHLGNSNATTNLSYSISTAGNITTSAYNIYGDITLTARWTVASYTVTFDKNGGTGGSNSVSATYGSAMPSATMPTIPGYVFDGYYADMYNSQDLYIWYDGLLNNGISSARNASATTWVDLMGHANATLNGTPTWSSNGYVLSGDDFARTANVSVGAYATYEIRLTIDSSLSLAHIIDHRDAAGSTGTQPMYWNGSAIQIYPNSDYLGSVGKSTYTLTAVYDGTSVKLYINGVLAGSKTGSNTSSNAFITLGARCSDTNKFIGTMYSFRLYTRALTAAEIASNYEIDQARFASGKGVKYYNANGTSAKNWDIAFNTTLKAYWTKAVLSQTWNTALGATATDITSITTAVSQASIPNDATDVSAAGYEGTVYAKLTSGTLTFYTLASKIYLPANCTYLFCTGKGSYAFADILKYVTSITMSNFDSSEVTSMNAMFRESSALTSLTFGANFTTSIVTDMSYMFEGCTKLATISGLNGFSSAALTNTSRMFASCSALTSLTFGTGFTTASVTDMSGMFLSCSKLTSITGLNYFTSTALTTTNQMFSGCSALTSLTFGTGFTTASVTTMNYMFYGCTNLASITGLNRFTSTALTNCSCMFQNCSSFTSLTFGSGFTTASVTNMSYMFSGCSSLTGITGLNYFTSTALTGIGYMFNGCSSLTSITLSFSASNVTNMANLFANCTNLETVDISAFNVKSTCSTTGMLYPCNALKKVYCPATYAPSSSANLVQAFLGPSFYDITKVDTTARTALSSATNGKTIVRGYAITYNTDGGTQQGTYDSVYLWSTGTAAIGYATRPGYAATAVSANVASSSISGGLTSNGTLTVPTSTASAITVTWTWTIAKAVLSQTWNTALGATATDITSITTAVSQASIPNDATDVSATGYEGTVFAKFASNTVTFYAAATKIYLPANCSYIFFSGRGGYSGNNLTSLTTIDLSNFDASDATNMSYMFITSLTSITLGSMFTTDNVTTMNYMFGGNYSITSITGLQYLTSNSLTDTSQMFANCSSLTSLTFGSGFTTANVTTMSQMFYNCSSLTSITGLNNFTSTALTTTYEMFQGCSSLTSLTFGSGFTTASVTDMTGMFDSCTNLESITGLNYFTSTALTTTYKMFYYCSSLTSLTFGSGFTTASVTDMDDMFRDCTNLASINGLTYFNTSNVTRMYEMFRNCSSLTSLDLSSFTLRSNTNLKGMLWGCTALEYLDISNFDLTLGYPTVGSTSPWASACRGVVNGNVDQKGILDDCSSLLLIKAPKKCPSTYNGSMYGQSFTVSFPIYDGSTYSYYNINNASSSAYKTLPNTSGTSMTIGRGFNITVTNNHPSGGSGTSTVIGVYQGTYIKDSVSRPSGYILTGIYTAPSGGTQIINASNAITASTWSTYISGGKWISTGPVGTLYAQWDEYGYKITFATNGATTFTATGLDANNTTGPIDPEEVVQLSNYITIVSKAGYSFQGWMVTAGTVYSGAIYVESMDVSSEDDIHSITIGTILQNEYYFVMLAEDGVTITMTAQWAVPTKAVLSQTWNTALGATATSITSITSAVSQASIPADATDVSDSSYPNTVYAKLASNTLTFYTVTSKIYLPANCGYIFSTGKNSSTPTFTNLASISLTFDSSDVTSMANMFSGCSSLTSLTFDSGFTTTSVTNMSSMFSGCSALETLDIGLFTVGATCSVTNMFSGCSSLKKIVCPATYSNSSPEVINGYSFYDITKVDTTARLEISSVTNGKTIVRGYTITYTTNGGTQAGTYDSVYLWSTGTATIGYATKSGYRPASVAANVAGSSISGGLTTNGTLSVPASTAVTIRITWTWRAERYQLTLVTNGGRMDITFSDSTYSNYISISTIVYVEYESSTLYKDEYGSVTVTAIVSSYTGYLHNGYYTASTGGTQMIGITPSSVLISAFTGSSAVTYTAQWTRMWYADYYHNIDNVNHKIEISGYNGSDTVITVPGITDIYGTNYTTYINGGLYQNNTAITSVTIGTVANKAVGESLMGLFSGCTSLETVNLAGLNTTGCTSMQSMFEGCTSLETLDVSNFDTSSCIWMNNMFKNCSSLEELDLSNFNTSSCQDMRQMFYGCTSLETLDVSNFDTSSCWGMNEMFKNCSSLISLDLSSFTLTNSTRLTEMFAGCTALEYLDISNFDLTIGYQDIDSSTPWWTAAHVTGGGQVAQKGLLDDCSSLLLIKTPIRCPRTYYGNIGNVSITVSFPIYNGSTYSYYDVSNPSSNAYETLPYTSGTSMTIGRGFNITVTNNYPSGGSGTSTVTGVYQGTYIKGNVSRPAGYILAGIYTAPSGGTEIINASKVISASTWSTYISGGKWVVSTGPVGTLYAQWDEYGYKIAFAPNGATTFTTTEYVGANNTTIGLELDEGYQILNFVTAISRNGYTFTGWMVTAGTLRESAIYIESLEDEVPKPVIIGTILQDEYYFGMLAEDGVTITMTAQWAGIEYSINYVLNDGTHYYGVNSTSGWALTYTTAETLQTKNVGWAYKLGYDPAITTSAGSITSGGLTSDGTLSIPANTYGNITVTWTWTASNYDIVITVTTNVGTASKLVAMLDTTGTDYTSSEVTMTTGINQTATLTIQNVPYETAGDIKLKWTSASDGLYYLISTSAISATQSTSGTTKNEYTIINGSYEQGASDGAASAYASQLYAMTYNQNGVTATGMPSTEYKVYNVTYNISTTIPSNSTGWTFIGYNTSNTAQTGQSTFTGNADQTFYAIWSKVLSVLFYQIGSSSATPVNSTIYNGSAATTFIGDALTVTAPSGYTAGGWASTSASHTKALNSGATSVTFTAGDSYYAFASKDVTISYNANGKTSTMPGNDTQQKYAMANGTTTTIYDGATFTLASAPTATGYTFSKWAEGTAGGTQYSAGDSRTLDANTTYYAIWNAVRYAITLNPQSGSVGVTFSNSTSIASSASNATIYAEYDSVVLYKESTGNVTVTAITTARPGYTHTGYFTAASAGTKVINASTAYELISAFTGTTAVTYHAQWAGIEYNITYVLNDGTHNYGESGTSGWALTYTTGEEQQTKNVGWASRVGYTINTLTTNKGTITSNYTSNETLTIPANTYGDITITWTWTASTYTVTFNANGATTLTTSGLVNNSFTATYDTAYQISSYITSIGLTGYTMKWHVTSGLDAGTGVYSSDNSVWNALTSSTDIENENWIKNLTPVSNGSVTLTAQWTANTYTVTFDANGAGIFSTQNCTPTTGDIRSFTATYDTVYQISDYVTWITRSWRTFKGFRVTIGLNTETAKYSNSLSSNPTNPITITTDLERIWHFKNLTAEPNGTVVLTARWVAIYTVTFNSNNATTFNTTGLDNNVLSADTDDPYQISTYILAIERTGYTFMGWNATSGLNTSTAKYSTDNSTWVNLDSASIDLLNDYYFKNLTTTANANVTLTARWNVNTYAIEYVTNGGTHYYGASAVTGWAVQYTFSESVQTKNVGWAYKLGYDPAIGASQGTITSGGLTSDGTLSIPANTYGDITITWTWTASTYTITYVLDGGTHYTGNKVTSGWDVTYTFSESSQTANIGWAEKLGFVVDTLTSSVGTITGGIDSNGTLNIPANNTGSITITWTWAANGKIVISSTYTNCEDIAMGFIKIIDSSSKVWRFMLVRGETYEILGVASGNFTASTSASINHEAKISGNTTYNFSVDGDTVNITVAVTPKASLVGGFYNTNVEIVQQNQNGSQNVIEVETTKNNSQIVQLNEQNSQNVILESQESLIGISQQSKLDLKNVVENEEYLETQNVEKLNNKTDIQNQKLSVKIDSIKVKENAVDSSYLFKNLYNIKSKFRNVSNL